MIEKEQLDIIRLKSHHACIGLGDFSDFIDSNLMFCHDFIF